MGTPSLSTVHQPGDHAEPVEAPVGRGGDELLAEIDSLLEDLSRRDLQYAAGAASALDARQVFLTDFVTRCEQEARPAMTAVLERLQRDGGGGLIEEHPGGEARFTTPRLTLWMSLQGQIVGSPRQDRHPYLQLEADAEEREVRVSEGDMWRGRDGHSGRMGSWQLDEITRERTTGELLAIIRRSVAVP
jgi:hypothetical protein